MSEKFDPGIVERGRAIASQIAVFRDGAEFAQLSAYRGGLSTDDCNALDTYRAFQLTTLIPQVEESEDGARIRAEEAQSAYRQIVAKEFQRIVGEAQ